MVLDNDCGRTGIRQNGFWHSDQISILPDGWFTVTLRPGKTVSCGQVPIDWREVSSPNKIGERLFLEMVNWLICLCTLSVWKKGTCWGRRSVLKVLFWFFYFFSYCFDLPLLGWPCLWQAPAQGREIKTHLSHCCGPTSCRPETQPAWKQAGPWVSDDRMDLNYYTGSQPIHWAPSEDVSLAKEMRDWRPTPVPCVRPRNPNLLSQEGSEQ